jgi:hypothetical protein
LQRVALQERLQGLGVGATLPSGRVLLLVQEGGFTFNTGVEDVSGLWKKGPVTYLLNELGLKRDDLFVKNRRRMVFKGRAIDAR